MDIPSLVAGAVLGFLLDCLRVWGQISFKVRKARRSSFLNGVSRTIVEARLLRRLYSRTEVSERIRDVSAIRGDIQSCALVDHAAKWRWTMEFLVRIECLLLETEQLASEDAIVRLGEIRQLAEDFISMSKQHV